MAKKLTKVERFLLENQGADYTSYDCPVHGIVQTPTSMAPTGTCPFSTCTQPLTPIADPANYLRPH